ncbi:MAG: hypothetical protein ACLQDM_08675 [Bradyrhizobium sp.]
MPADARRRKITLAEMRAAGVRGVLIYCADYRWSHSLAISADRCPDDLRLPDIEDRFTCTACGPLGAGSCRQGKKPETGYRELVGQYPNRLANRL